MWFFIKNFRFKYLKEWCEAQQISVTQNPAELVALTQVKQVIGDEINKLNKSLPEPERILRFRILADEWTPASGELSATLKLKRKVIEAKYKEIIDGIYRKEAHNKRGKE